MAVTIDGTNGVSGPINVTTDSVKLDGNYPTGTNNVALGDGALDDGSLSGGFNTAVGHGSMTANTSGQENAAFGQASLDANTTGSSNTAIGSEALTINTTASNNTAVGRRSLRVTTTGSDNIAVGSSALLANTTGTNNVVIGTEAGAANTTSSENTYVGRYAGLNATGASNTFFGRGSGSTVTSGSKNTILGRYNGNQGGLDIRTLSNYIVLSDGAGNPRGWFDTNGAFAIDHNVGYANTLSVVNRDSSNDIYGQFIYFETDKNSVYSTFLRCRGGSTYRCYIRSTGNLENINNSYGGISDQKLKENIADAPSQWDDIKALQIRKYSFIDEQSDTPTQLGVIAQELEASGMSGLVSEAPDLDPDTDADLGTTTKSVKYSVLYMKAVKALQEAMDRIEALEAKVATLEGN